MDVSESAIRDRLRRFIVDEILGVPGYDVGDDDALITGGLIDSFHLAHVAAFIEAEYGVYVPDTELTAKAFDTVRGIAQYVVELIGGERGR